VHQTDESNPLNCQTCALLHVGQAPVAEGRRLSTVEHHWRSALGPSPCRCVVATKL